MLLLDPADRLLLLSLRAEDGGPDWWITVGGGLEPGEDPVAAAVREVAEETSLVLAPEQVGPEVWRGRRVLRWGGEVTDAREGYRVVRCPAVDPVLDGLQPHEVRAVTGWRWWRAGELVAAEAAQAAQAGGGRIRPAGLGRHLVALLAGDHGPLDLGTAVDGAVSAAQRAALGIDDDDGVAS